MKFGDFIYNNYPDDLIVREGSSMPNPDPDHDKAKANNEAIAEWPAQVAKLKQQGSVRDVFLSVGGPPGYWPDFANIAKMFAQDDGAQLKRNLVALKDAFTFDGRCVIDGFDIDCEERPRRGQKHPRRPLCVLRDAVRAGLRGDVLSL